MSACVQTFDCWYIFLKDDCIVQSLHLTTHSLIKSDVRYYSLDDSDAFWCPCGWENMKYAAVRSVLDLGALSLYWIHYSFSSYVTDTECVKEVEMFADKPPLSSMPVLWCADCFRLSTQLPHFSCLTGYVSLKIHWLFWIFIIQHSRRCAMS